MEGLAISPKRVKCFALALFSAGALLSIACGEPVPPHDVGATYDATTGQLRQLTINTKSDGKPNITSQISGGKFIKIEVDSDEDGKLDRWEYYGDDEKLSRVGISRANDGIEDAWVYRGADGSIERTEISTKRDGKANRTEFYEKGVLTRAQEDANLDGRVDKWEQYESGVLVSASFDTTNSGHPTTSVDYRKP